MHTSHRFLILVICIGWCLPLGLGILQQIPGAQVVSERPISGAEDPVDLHFDLTRLRSGAWQRAVATASVRGLFGRPSLVRTANSLGFLLAGRLPSTSDRLVLADDGWLFERDYCEDWLDRLQSLVPVTPEAVAPAVADLQVLAANLAARGVPLIVLLAPSKAATVPGHLPEAWQQTAPVQRDYDRLASSFAATLGDHWFDAADWMRQNLPESEAFTRIGTHWSYLAAARVAVAVTDQANARLGANLPTFRIAETRLLDTCQGTDRDLGELLNLWWVPAAPSYAFTWSPVATRNLRLVLVGDSFTWTLAKVLIDTDAFTAVDLIYYNSTHYRVIDGGNTPVDQDVLTGLLRQADLVIVEWNEAFFGCPFWRNFAREQVERLEP